MNTTFSEPQRFHGCAIPLASAPPSTNEPAGPTLPASTQTAHGADWDAADRDAGSAAHAPTAGDETDDPRGLGGLLLAHEPPAHIPSWRAESLRFGSGLGLSAVYGLALGSRDGGASLVGHALGTPAALLAVGAVGVPAFAIVLALMNAPVDGARLAAVTARATAATGLVLAGLAPAALLFALTSSTREAAAGTALVGLVVAGGIGIAQLIGGLRRTLSRADSATRLLALLASLGFGLFAVALAARVWSATLPALARVGGAS